MTDCLTRDGSRFGSPISTVSKGDEYYCELYVRRSSGTVPDGNALVQVRWTLNDGTASYSTVGTVSTLSTVQVSNIVVAPESAVDASIWIRPNVSGTVGAVFLARPFTVTFNADMDARPSYLIP